MTSRPSDLCQKDNLVTRHCPSCDRSSTKSIFRLAGWITPGKCQRCYSCSTKRHIDNSERPKERSWQTARRNNATRAIFSNYDLENPFAEGQFRWVAKGVYTHGSRAGQACVCKWFKSGQVFDERFFNMDLEAMNMALSIVQKWNNHKFINKIVKVNVPEVWSSEITYGRWAGIKALQEPFIENYAKFNSNSGWADDSKQWFRVMQALSHFSYHISGGEFLLCDLQGGVYSDAVVLTDPVIMSRSRKYGMTDLGAKGISSFFSRHVCNEFCKKKWSLPSKRRCYFDPRKGTSMIRTGAKRQVCTLVSVDPLTKILQGNSKVY